MAITVDTKLIPLIGTPLRQSFSPRMQNATYKHLGLDMHYFPLEATSEHLGDIINGIRHMNIGGFAVTKPNKVEVLQYLDEIDELAQKMGAVNTVTIDQNGKIKGYNTDGEGAVLDLKTNGNVDIPNTTFFSLGAGGAGRAVCFTLAKYGAKKIYIASSTGTSAEELAKDLKAAYGTEAEACKISDTEKMLPMVKDSQVVMNLAGIGMYPNLTETWIDKKELEAHKPLCYDATYNPDKTQFLLDAESVGCKVMNGIGWVVTQGALQIKLWTGKDEPYEFMRKEMAAIVADAAKK